MSANPPILTIPSQPSRPVEHINRYLSSLHPHRPAHASEGQRRFLLEEEHGFEEVRSYWAGADSSSAGRWSEVVQNRQVRNGVPKGREDEAEKRRPGETAPADSGPSASFRVQSGPSRRWLGAEELATYRPVGQKSRRQTELPEVPERDPDRDDTESETSSAQRRYHRKLRRREKAALRRPPPPPPLPASPSPPPQPLAHPKRTASVIGGSELSGLQYRLPPSKRRKAGEQGLEYARKFEATNVAVKRLTLRPERSKGFLGRGASSAVFKPQERFTNDHEQSMEEEDWVNPRHRRLVPPRQAFARQSHDAIDRIARSTHPSPESGRSGAVRPLPPDEGDSRAQLLSRLPPPGLTNSSPWPSEIVRSSKSGGSGHKQAFVKSFDEARSIPTKPGAVLRSRPPQDSRTPSTSGVAGRMAGVEPRTSARRRGEPLAPIRTASIMALTPLMRSHSIRVDPVSLASAHSGEEPAPDALAPRLRAAVNPRPSQPAIQTSQQPTIRVHPVFAGVRSADAAVSPTESAAHLTMDKMQPVDELMADFGYLLSMGVGRSADNKRPQGSGRGFLTGVKRQNPNMQPLNDTGRLETPLVSATTTTAQLVQPRTPIHNPRVRLDPVHRSATSGTARPLVSLLQSAGERGNELMAASPMPTPRRPISRLFAPLHADGQPLQHLAQYTRSDRALDLLHPSSPFGLPLNPQDRFNFTLRRSDNFSYADPFMSPRNPFLPGSDQDYTSHTAARFKPEIDSNSQERFQRQVIAARKSPQLVTSSIDGFDMLSEAYIPRRGSSWSMEDGQRSDAAEDGDDDILRNFWKERPAIV